MAGVLNPPSFSVFLGTVSKVGMMQAKMDNKMYCVAKNAVLFVHIRKFLFFLNEAPNIKNSVRLQFLFLFFSCKCPAVTARLDATFLLQEKRAMIEVCV